VPALRPVRGTGILAVVFSITVLIGCFPRASVLPGDLAAGDGDPPCAKRGNHRGLYDASGEHR